MKVYFEAPRTAPYCALSYVFPNDHDIPTSYSGETLIARFAEDAEYYRIVQKDLMDLATLTWHYLNDFECTIEGRALMYYRSQPLASKSMCKKLNVPKSLFSFGTVIQTAYGECGFYLQPKPNQSLCIYSTGMGIAEEVIRKVIMSYIWKARVSIEFQPHSKFRELCARSSPTHRWYGMQGRGFNIPSEEIE